MVRCPKALFINLDTGFNGFPNADVGESISGIRPPTIDPTKTRAEPKYNELNSL